MTPWIVVGGTDLGESDRLVRFLTADTGRVTAVARGARASRKRFAGLLDLGNRVQVDARKGRGELQRLTAVDAIATPTVARTDLDRIALLAWGCELCAALAPEGGAAPRLHRLLEVWLDLLEGDALPGVASRLALEAKALTFAGITPALVHCARTGVPLVGVVGFDAGAGGGVSSGGDRRVPAAALATLERLRRTPLAETVGGERPPPGVHWILADFAEHHLGRRLRARALLGELGTVGPGHG